MSIKNLFIKNMDTNLPDLYKYENFILVIPNFDNMTEEELFKFAVKDIATKSYQRGRREEKAFLPRSNQG